jgi:hypothetical protein
MGNQDYQRKIVLAAIKRLISKHKVGLDIFTRGGKSYIAMDVISYMLERSENKNKYVIIMAPKSVADNLEGNVMKDFDYFKQLIFMNYEKLSRKIKITDYLKENHINTDKVCMIVMDEAHKAFGEICRDTFLQDEEFIYSKYIVAMTATPYSNLSGVHSLDELVGNENVIRYHFDEAIKDKVARKINYIPAVLSYDVRVLKQINELKNNFKDNAYLVQLIDKFEELNDEISFNESKAICNYLTENVKLSCKDGARVFVFFSSIDRLESGKDTVIEAITNAYKKWGDKKVEYRYLNFTSASNEDEIDKIRDILSRDPMKNTIDIICTVQMGVMGIHPSHTHFALMMSATTSLQKLMQMIGRVTNLYAYDDTDTTVFDLKDSLAAIDRVTYKPKGKNLLQDLVEVMYDKEAGNIRQYYTTVNIKDSKISSESLELLEKIKLVESVIKDSSDVIQYIEQELPNIDKYENGSILDYIKNKKSRSDSSLERRLMLKRESVYKQLLKIAFNDDYDDDIRESVIGQLSKFEYRIYIKECSNKYSADNVKKVYELSKKYAEDKEVTDGFTKYVLYPLSCNNLTDNEVRILKDLGVLQLITKEQLQEAKSKAEDILKQLEEEERARLIKLENEEKARRKEIEREKREARARKKEIEREKREARARKKEIEEKRRETYNKRKRIKSLYNDCLGIARTIPSQINEVSDILNHHSIVSDKHKYYRTICISVNKYKTVNYDTEEIEYNVNAFSKVKYTFTEDEVININNEIEQSLNCSNDTLKYLKSNFDKSSFDSDDTEEELKQLKSNIRIHTDSLSKIINSVKCAKMIESYILKISPKELVELKSQLGIDNWEDDIDTADEKEYKDKIAYIKKLSKKTSARKSNTLDIKIKDNNSLNIGEIIKHNQNSYDILIALFTQILFKQIKVHVRKSGGEVFTTNYSIKNEEVTEYKDILTDRVGKNGADLIINSANEYLQNDNIKFIMDIVFGNIDSEDIEQTINNSISAHEYIKNTEDRTAKNIFMLLELDEDIRIKTFYILRKKCGFGLYEKIITTDGEYITSDELIQSTIYKNLSKEIRENVGVPLYYAIEKDNKFLINELFATDKYYATLMNYALANKQYSSFVNDKLLNNK